VVEVAHPQAEFKDDATSGILWWPIWSFCCDIDNRSNTGYEN